VFLDKARPACGWTDRDIPCAEADLFATWFRLASVVIISRILRDLPESTAEYRFLKTPGLGWFPQ
jgi:hypothetical protein